MIYDRGSASELISKSGRTPYPIRMAFPSCCRIEAPETFRRRARCEVNEREPNKNEDAIVPPPPPLADRNERGCRAIRRLVDHLRQRQSIGTLSPPPPPPPHLDEYWRVESPKAPKCRGHSAAPKKQTMPGKTSCEVVSVRNPVGHYAVRMIFDAGGHATGALQLDYLRRTRPRSKATWEPIFPP